MRAMRLIEIDVPEVPSTVHVTGGRSWDTIDVRELSDETLNELAEAWKTALIALAQAGRKLDEQESVPPDRIDPAVEPVPAETRP